MLIDTFVQIRWYGLMFALGFWIGTNIVARMFKRDNAPESWLGWLLIYTVLGTLIGARLGHVFFYEWDWYSAHPEHILRIWVGGLAATEAPSVSCSVCSLSRYSRQSATHYGLLTGWSFRLPLSVQ